MTEAQRVMLFCLFARLSKASTWGPAQRELHRERITRAVFGEKKSWSDLSNREVDWMKSRLELELRPANLAAARKDVGEEQDEAGERKRLVFAIERDAKRGGLSENYIIDMLRVLQLRDTLHWRELPIEQLTSLRNAVHNRAHRKCAKAKGTARPRKSKARRLTEELNAEIAKAAKQKPLKVRLEVCETMAEADIPF